MYTDVIKIEYPTEAVAGELVTIQVFIKNQYSASIYIAPRAIVNSVIPVTFTIPYAVFPAGATYYFTGTFTMPSENAVIRAESYYWSVDDEWVFEDYQTRTVRLTGGVAPVFETLEIDITPTASGHVTTDIASEEGRSIWYHNSTGTFPEGTTVRVTAVPSDGYEFDHWSDEIEGGINYDNPAMVQPLTEYRAVKAHFKEEVPTGILTGLRSTAINCQYAAYDYGAPVPYVLGYDYKGEAQGGTLIIEIGTGVYPLFTPIAVIGPVSYDFARSINYTRTTENKSFVLPSTLLRGQVYSVRVVLATADGLSDNDIDYTALKVLDDTVPSTDLQGLVVATSYRDYELGEQLSYTLSFKYKGIAQTGKLQISIKRGLFIVHTYDELTVDYDESAVLNTVNWSEYITLPETLDPGQVYGLYVRLTTQDGRDTSNTKGSAFKIAEDETPEDPGVSEYRKVKDFVYPYAAGYTGVATEATVEFTVPLAQLPGGDWLSQLVLDEFENQVAGRGSHMLQLVVYERDEGLTSRGYKLIAIATPPDEVAGQEFTSQGVVNLAYIEAEFTPGVWALIVLGALLAIGFIVSAIVPSVRKVIWGEGGVIDTITDIGSTIGNILPLMIIVMMMAMMMEQTRGMYEPPGTPPRPKPVTEAVVKVSKVALEAGKVAAPYVVEAAKKAVKAADSAVKYATKQVKEAAEQRRTAAEADRKFYEERETEKKRKLNEAMDFLKKKREEQRKLD